MSSYDEIYNNILEEVDADGEADAYAHRAIKQAQRRIFRNLRAPINEALWSSTISSSYDTIIPDNFFEMIDMSVGGKPIKQIIPYQNMLALHQSPDQNIDLYTDEDYVVARYGMVFVYPKWLAGHTSILHYYKEMDLITPTNQTSGLSDKASDLIEYAAIADTYRFLKNQTMHEYFKEEFNTLWQDFDKSTKDADYNGAGMVIPGNANFY